MPGESELQTSYRRVREAFTRAPGTADGRHDTPRWRGSTGPYAACIVRVPADMMQPQLSGVRDQLEHLSEVRLHPDHFLHIMLQELGFVVPHPSRPDEISRDRLEEFAQEMVRRSNEAYGVMASVLGKARGQVARLATILEHLWWAAVPNAAEPSAISEKAVMAAAGLVDGYFIPMAERVFGDAAIPEAERHAMALVRHLRQHALTHFNARQLRRQIGGGLRKPECMNAACSALVEAGLIRPKPSRVGGTEGRCSTDYEVNPALYGGVA